MNTVLCSLVLILLAVVSAIFPTLASGQTAPRSVGTWSGVDVQLFEVPGSLGIYDYFVLAVPNTGKSKYPIVVVNNPYAVMPAPWSRNSTDAVWTGRVQSTSMYSDITFPDGKKIFPCDVGDCPIFVQPSSALNDLSTLGDFGGEGKDNALINQLFQDGYAVAILMNGHYRGSDSIRVMEGVRNSIFTLKQNTKIDPQKMGIIGRSQGGQLAIHPFTFPSDDLHIAAAISESGWTDAPKFWEYAYNELPRTQLPHLYLESQSFYAPYFNRWAASAFGRNPSNWTLATHDSVASRFKTPLLMIHGTDDCMVPVDQTQGFFSAVKARGLSVNKWVYENRAPPLNTMPILNCAHGILDANKNTKKRVLYRNFFLAKMPLDHDVSSDGNTLPAMMEEFADAYFKSTTNEDRENVLDLIAQASNPRIKYVSSDPLLSGAGDSVVPVLKEKVFSTWQTRLTVRRVPEDIDIPSLFRGYVSEYCYPWTTETRRAQIVALVLARVDQAVMYVSSDPNFPSGRGDTFIPAASNKVVTEFFTAPGRRCGY